MSTDIIRGENGEMLSDVISEYLQDMNRAPDNIHESMGNS